MGDIMEPYIKLLETATVPELGPGPRPGVKGSEELSAALDEAGAGALSWPYGELVRGVVLLWHDHLEAAHELAQAIENPDGSYLHAIMHRREPDFSNAKYWFRRVGKHPCYQQLAERAAPMLRGSSRLIVRGQWDPMTFVDACEAAQPGEETELLKQIQAVEFNVFLQYLGQGIFKGSSAGPRPIL